MGRGPVGPLAHDWWLDRHVLVLCELLGTEKVRTMTSNGYLLQTIDLRVSREDREILRGVNLVMNPNTVHAVLGLNGSGKSTLAYTLVGSAGYAPSRGQILFEGRDIVPLGISERGKLGITLAWQEPARFEGLTVERYLGLGMGEPDRKRVEQALARSARLIPLSSGELSSMECRTATRWERSGISTLSST